MPLDRLKCLLLVALVAQGAIIVKLIEGFLELYKSLKTFRTLFREMFILLETQADGQTDAHIFE